MKRGQLTRGIVAVKSPVAVVIVAVADQIGHDVHLVVAIGVDLLDLLDGVFVLMVTPFLKMTEGNYGQILVGHASADGYTLTVIFA